MINWFKSIENKHNCKFISFDVVEYYPSITEDLLNKALDFASKFDTITPEERSIILHAKRSFLFCEESTWGKTEAQDLFDVTMGSWDGAETCELVGNYLLSVIQKKHGNNIGLYRDDGLRVFEATPQKEERIKKSLCKVFEENGLKVTIEANLDEVNFLNVTLNLPRNSFAPFTKPNNTIKYVHSQSNHPPNILKNIPIAINKRLLELSSIEEAFNNAKPPYQEALKNSGYEHELKYEKATQENTAHKPEKRNRQRNIMWYNPPFSPNVQTNVGKSFLRTVKRSFPPGHPLHKIFNQNTLKLSYSCMPNVRNIIDNRNKKIQQNAKTDDTEQREKSTKSCNC